MARHPLPKGEKKKPINCNIAEKYLYSKARIKQLQQVGTFAIELFIANENQ